MLIKKVEIVQIMPCIADSAKIRVIAKADSQLGEVLPYLDRVIPTALYSERGGFLTYKRGLSIITLHASGEIAMTQIRDRDEAVKILNEIKERINDTWERRGETDLRKLKERIQSGPLNLYVYLPKTNCGECGEKTCMAFAIKVLNEGKKFGDCTVLAEDKYSGAKETLVALLESAGYEVEV
jgi:ArsR family metal-binding transcriptional regulator